MPCIAVNMLNPYLVAVTIVTENSLIVEYFNKEFCCMTVNPDYYYSYCILGSTHCTAQSW